MDDQKIENLLNLALDATEEEREKSETLEVGYDPVERTWKVIVRYHGDLESAAQPDWQVAILTGGYAIITLPQSEVDVLASLPEIEYVEKPKRLYFSVEQGRAASCVSALQTAQYNLFGQGVLVAVIDSGVDYFHPDFRDDNGNTRIAAIWDQTAKVPEDAEIRNRNLIPENAGAGNENLTDENAEITEWNGIPENANFGDQNVTPKMTEEGEAEEGTGNKDTEERAGQNFRYTSPAGFTQGVEYTREMINAALAQGSREAAWQIVPERDISGHGTQVLGIAAGNGRSSGGRQRGMAPLADILVVKLGIPEEGGFPRTTEVMQAVEYVMKKAQELNRPVAINLSFGNAYGSHRGTSLLETYLSMMANRWKNVIVAGTGNEGNSGGHFAGKLGEREEQVIEFTVSAFEPTLNLQLWKNYADGFRVTIVHPNGQTAGPLGGEAGTARYRLGNTNLLVYYGEPSPYQGLQEIYIDFLAADTYIDSGIWRIILTPQRIVSGEYQLWMPDSRARNDNTHFLQPTPDTTLTIPSTAPGVIAVGAYDARRMTYASFSGRGWETEPFFNRPDLAAPGVDITTTTSGGGYVSVTGTSFAAPFVTGAAALMMQWGIVEGNDPYLYGEKLRVSLNRGARQLTAEAVYPNPRIGYGALCVRDSLPI